MTALTDDALAALDAVVAKATPGEWPKSVVFIRNLLTKSRYHDHAEAIAALRDNTIAIVALHNAYPALRVIIDVERAMADWAAARERAAIVAWMRDVGPHWDVKTIISAIIRGDHKSGGNAEAVIHAAKSNEVK
jgi:hypothetical protein